MGGGGSGSGEVSGASGKVGKQFASGSSIANRSWTPGCPGIWVSLDSITRREILNFPMSQGCPESQTLEQERLKDLA